MRTHVVGPSVIGEVDIAEQATIFTELSRLSIPCSRPTFATPCPELRVRIVDIGKGPSRGTVAWQLTLRGIGNDESASASRQKDAGRIIAEPKRSTQSPRSPRTCNSS